MKFVLYAAALLAVALARPEIYKENEEFKYSRKSSDEGSKSGFYEAQRGNVGGNYEKAHNMDQPAQHTLSQAIHQVDGVIGGENARLRQGDVFNTGSTRGLYSQGQYDLSNLSGRNFQEGESHGEAASHSGFTSGYGRESSYSGYGGRSEAYTHGSRGNLQQSFDGDWQAGNQLQNGYHEYGKESSHRSAYRSEGYHANQLGNTGAYYTKTGAPVKIMIRPGGTVNLPVTAETYQDRESSSHYKSHALNQEVESSGIDSDLHYQKPNAGPKHYESSYEYRKEWEKHDAKPMPAPLAVLPAVPVPSRSELYDENTVSSGRSAFRGNSLDQHNNEFSKYKASSRSESQYESEYNRRLNEGAVESDFKNIDTSGLAALTANVPTSLPAPKKYESSYSYHKSWERQGDPYVIKTVPSESLESQRLTAANQGSYSHQYGSQQRKSHSSYTHGANIDCDCDDAPRAKRSLDSQRQVNDPYHQMQNYEGQQVQSENLEDFGQETQSAWDLRDFSQHSGKLEDIGQQQTDNLESFAHSRNHEGRQQQNSWDQRSNIDLKSQGKEVNNYDNIYLNSFGQASLNKHEPHKALKPPHESLQPLLSPERYDNNHTEQKVDTESQLDDTQTSQNAWRHKQSDQYSNTNRHRFRSTAGTNPFPAHQWHDITQDRYNMHGYDHRTVTNDESRNNKPLQNVWDQINSYQFKENVSNHFDMSSSNENRFRSQWSLPKDEVLTSNTEKLSTTPVYHNIASSMGRGDIEADDIVGDASKPKINQPIEYKNDKPNKSAEEIEALSQTQYHNSQNIGQSADFLSVQGINQQENNEKLKNNGFSGRTFSDSTPNKANQHSEHNRDTDISQSSNQQQSLDQQLTDFGQDQQTGFTLEENLRDFTQRSQTQSADQHRKHSTAKANKDHNKQLEPTQQLVDRQPGMNSDNLNLQEQTVMVDDLQNQQSTHDFQDFKLGQQQQTLMENFNDDTRKNAHKHEQTVGHLKQDEHEQTISTTEKPGFWKNLGSKIGSAKDKVSSWFGS